MSPGAALDWLEEMLWAALLAGSPVLVTVTVVGLVVAILQAATQVNDAAVPFTVKALGVFFAITATGAWMMGQVLDFASGALEAIARVTGG